MNAELTGMPICEPIFYNGIASSDFGIQKNVV